MNIRATVPQANNNYDDWVDTITTIRNDSSTLIGLVATVTQNDVPFSPEQHATFTYVWSKNGVVPPDNGNQIDGRTGVNERAYLINGDDISDGGSDAFICTVTYSQ